MGYFSNINFVDLASSAGSSFFASKGVDISGVTKVLTPAGSSTADAKAATQKPPKNGTPVQAKSDDPGTTTKKVSDKMSLHMGNPYVIGAICVVIAVGAYFALKK